MKSGGKRAGKVKPFAEAKTLGKLVDEAKKHGPQVIRRHGVEEAVILSMSDYARLTKPKGSLIDFLQNSPLAGSDLEVERSKDPGRGVDL